MSRRFGVTFDPAPANLTPETVVAGFPTAPGLYVHVPFCHTPCPFCPYNKVRFRENLAQAYLVDLAREAQRYLAAGPASYPSLYVGGGTPTLCLDGLEPLLARLPVSGERAIEVLPQHLTPAGAERLAGLGFTHVSIGVQSFDPAVLHRLRRPGTAADARNAVESALGRFECVDVDLIFDTGFDHPDVLLADLARCFRYGVDQVSTYPLMRFGFTPFGKGHHDRRTEHALLREATGLAADHGYERRAVWTFHRPGSATYSSITRPYYLGIGAGAATFTGNLFLVNHFGLVPYARAVAEERLPVARATRLSRSAAAAYRTFWQAYTGTIPIGSDDPLLRHPVSVGLRGVTQALGWTRGRGDSVALTARGYRRYHDLERWVTYHLIEPLWAELITEHAQSPVATGSAP